MSEQIKPLPCLKCGQQLGQAMPQDNPRLPLGGTVFVSHGHYGSTVFDDMHGRWIEIVICDDCIRAAVGQGKILHGSAGPVRMPPPPVYTDFDPDKH